jgi:peptide/nickel transport system ATP-binding protein
MTETLLSIQNLYVNYKIFEGTLKVLNGVNLELGKGEKIGLIGETGCGKTTTMKSILRILPQPPAIIQGGKIFFEGDDIFSADSKRLNQLRRLDVSMIFQDPTASLNPVFKVGVQLGDVIKYGALEAGESLSKEEIKHRSVEILKDVALPDPERLLDNYPIQLSGGMRQRICIAMALVSANKLLIADEPSTNLDVTIGDQVLRLIGNLVEEKGTSVIIISHALGAVKGLVDRVAVMYAGNIIEDAKKEDLFSDPLHPYTKGLINSVPKLTGGGIPEGISGSLPNYIDPPSGCRFSPRCPHVMSICRESLPQFMDAGERHKVACYLYGDECNE